MGNADWMPIIIVAAACFLLLKAIFGLLGWYSQLGSDALYRSQLDRLWDELHAFRFSEIAHRALKRLLAKVESFLARPWRALLILGSFSVGINALSLLIGLLVFSTMENTSLNKFMSVEATMVIFTVIPFVACLFDLISFWITIALLRHACRSTRLSVLLGHVGIDLVVAAIALLWVLISISAFAFFTVSRVSFFDELAHQASIFSEGLGDLLQGADTGLAAGAVINLILGASTGLPTLAYLTIWLALVTVWLLPEGSRPIFRNTIYLVSTDKKPVLSQLGTFLGGCAAALGAVVMLMKA